MGKLTIKSKHTVKVGNYPLTNMISKQAIMRRGEYKCRILEMHLKLRDQQLKTTFCIYIYTAISKPNGKCKPENYNRYTHKKEKATQMQH